MTLFPLRQLWRLLTAIAVAAPIALAPLFAIGDDINIDVSAVTGVTLTTNNNPSNVTYTFLDTQPPSGPVIIDLSESSAALSIYAAFNVNTDATIYTTKGSGKTAAINGKTLSDGSKVGITIDNKKTLTFGKSSDSTDVGIINVNAAISGGQAININRGSKDAETVLNHANSGFKGAINIDRGILTINNSDATNAKNFIFINEEGTLKLGDASTATVQMINNKGTINLNNKTLVLAESGSELGEISNGHLQFNSNFTLDNSAKLTNVDFILNGAKMTVATDSSVSNIQAAKDETGTDVPGYVDIAEGKTLTLTNPGELGTGITYQSNKKNGGTLAFGSEDGALSGNFTTSSTPQLSTTDGNLVNVQVNRKSSWTLKTGETVNSLILKGGSDAANASAIKLGNNTLTVTDGINSSGEANISGSGEVKLAKATDIVGDGTLTIENINMNSNALLIQADKTVTSDNPYTVNVNNISNHGAITINGNTVLQTNLTTSEDLNIKNGAKLVGNLTQTGTGELNIKDGTYNVAGNAKFSTGNYIVMDTTKGSNSASMPGLSVSKNLVSGEGGKLIFNTDATEAIKSDDADMTVVMLSGYRSGEGLKVTLKADDGIYGYGNGTGSKLENVGKKPSTIIGGTEYIVYDTDSQENYFKILLDDTAAFDVDSLTYNNGALDINLKARSTSDNPIEQVLVNGVNEHNPYMEEIYTSVNDAPDRESALNQLNPYTVSATTANQMWISQEYASRTLQRMKMVRAAVRGFDTFVPIGPGYADIDNSEVSYLAQSYGYPEFEYGYGVPYAFGPGYGRTGNQWWFRGIGAWERQEANGNLARYDTDYSGFTIGVDRLYGPGMLFGMSAGGVWNTTKFKDPGGSVAKGGTFLIDLYGSYFNECSHFDYLFGYQGATTDTTRRTDIGIDPSFGKIKSNTFIAAFEFGRTFRFLRNTLEPYYDLQYVNIQNDGLTEDGSAAALNIYKNNQHALLQTIGLRYMGSCAGPLKGYYFVPQVEVGWVHNYSNTDVISVAAFANDLSAGEFVTSGYRVPRDRVKVSVGLDIVFNPAAKFDIKYECQAGSGFGFHTLTGGFDWNF